MIHVRIISAAQQIIYGHVEVIGKSAKSIYMRIICSVFKLANCGT